VALNPKIGAWPGRVVWLVGASSGIGRATAHVLHTRGATVVVSARNRSALADFTAAHPGSQAIALDSTNRQALRDAATSIERRHGRIDQAVYCAGTYSAMRATEFDLDEALHHQQVNYIGALYLLDAVLPLLLRQADAGQPAHLSLMASVAGYRGLPKSLAYGPTKAALINLAETLYLDLQARGVAVSLVNPGFVRTPLTAQNNFRMPALISPEEAAEALVGGWQDGEFEITFPKRFTRWMKGLRLIHDAAYFALVRRAVPS